MIYLKTTLNVCLFFLAVFSFGQINVSLYAPVSDLECEEDSLLRKLRIEYDSGSGGRKLLREASFTGCEFTFPIPSLDRLYYLDVEVEGYEQGYSYLRARPEDTDLFEDIVIQKKQVVAKADSSIVIKPAQNVLKVSGKKFVEHSAGKTTVRVEGNEVLTDGTVWESITKLPGVVASPSGSVVLAGKEAVIWIDGQPTGLSGEDLVSLLNSLPANSVEEIEIISSPGAKYSANGDGGIINIITGKNKLRGVNGSFTSTHTMNEYLKSDQSLRLGSKFGIHNFNFLGGYKQFRGEEDERSLFTFSDVAGPFEFDQALFTETAKHVLFARLNHQFRFSRKFRINLKYNINYNQTDPLASSDNVFSEPLLNFKSEASQENEAIRHETGIKMDLDFSRRTKFSTELNYNNFSSDLLTRSTESGSAQVFYNNLSREQSNDNWVLKSDLEFEPGFWDLEMGTGLSADFVAVNSDGRYDTNSLDENTLNAPTYNTEDDLFFDYQEANYAAYLEARKKIGKLSLGTGLRGEYLDLEGVLSNTGALIQKQSNLRLFPTADLTYEFNKDLVWTGSYRRKIRRISYNQLDPNISSVFNSASQERGNPQLKPSIINRLETKLSFMNYLSLSFNYDRTIDPSYLVLQSDEGSVATRTNLTFPSSDTYAANLSLPIPFILLTKGMKGIKELSGKDPNKLDFLYLNTGFIYSRIKGAEEYIPNNDPLWYFAAYSKINLPLDIAFSIFYMYFNSGTYQAYDLTKSNQNFNVFLNRKFLDDKLKVGLRWGDLFNTDEYNVNLFADDLNVAFNQKKDTKFFRISLTYDFGKLKSSDTGSGNSDEEALMKEGRDNGIIK